MMNRSGRAVALAAGMGVALACAPGALADALDQQSYFWDGTAHTFIVPPNVTQLTIDAIGGYGGSGASTSQAGGGAGGLGGEAVGTFAVTPGQTFLVCVGYTGGDASGATGSGGGNNVCTGNGGFYHGGSGGAGDAPGAGGGGGGAASVVYAPFQTDLAAFPLLVAAGGAGGGGAGSIVGYAGGAGGSASHPGMGGTGGSGLGAGAGGTGGPLPGSGTIFTAGTTGGSAPGLSGAGAGGGGGGGFAAGHGGRGGDLGLGGGGGGGGGASYVDASALAVGFPAATGRTLPRVTFSWVQPTAAIVVVASRDPVLQGKPVTFTATVTPSPLAGPQPSGTVNFYLDGIRIGTGQLNGQSPDQATFTTSTLPVATHDIGVDYYGDALYHGYSSADLTETVSSLALAGKRLPAAQVGRFYSAAITATGGTAPYRWRLRAGQLPPGLHLTPIGSTVTVSGTPTTSGSFKPLLSVTDGATPSATAQATFPLTVTP
jgi:hypothetical protein